MFWAILGALAVFYIGLPLLIEALAGLGAEIEGEWRRFRAWSDRLLE